MKKEIEALKQKNEERKAFLKLIIAFVESFLLERGEVTDRGTTAYSCSTVKRELKNFAGFSFIWESDIDDYIDISDEKGKLRLSFRYGGENCEITTFDPDRVWQASLLDVMQRKDEIIAKILATKEEERQALKDQAEQERILAEVTAEAKKLKVV